MDKNRIKFEYDGVKYVLQYTLDSAATIEEEMGFKITQVQDLMVSSVIKLFRGAFIANHPNVSQDLIDEIYTMFADKKGLFQALAEMYVGAINAIFEEPKDDGKNVKWERVK